MYYCVYTLFTHPKSALQNAAFYAVLRCRPSIQVRIGIATFLCVIAVIPLFIGIFTEKEFFTVIMLIITMVLAGIGAVLFILSGVRWESMQKLLKEGEFAPEEKRRNQFKERVSGVYWLSANAIYLGWSFWTNEWGRTWIVWPLAGVLFAVVMCICNLFIDREK